MHILTYDKSKIYPDNSVIEWRPNEYHEGFINGKPRFRVYEHKKDSEVWDRHLQMMNPDGDWEIVSPYFHESTLYCQSSKNNRDNANKYNHYHSLHACHMVAENIIWNEFFKTAI